MRLGYIWAVITKEARDLLANRLLLLAVVFPALVFAAIPTAIVAFIEINELDPAQMGEIERYISQRVTITAIRTGMNQNKNIRKRMSGCVVCHAGNPPEHAARAVLKAGEDGPWRWMTTVTGC